MLVYASAENLNKYEGHLDDDELAINRHAEIKIVGGYHVFK